MRRHIVQFLIKHIWNMCTLDRMPGILQRVYDCDRKIVLLTSLQAVITGAFTGPARLALLLARSADLSKIHQPRQQEVGRGHRGR